MRKNTLGHESVNPAALLERTEDASSQRKLWTFGCGIPGNPGAAHGGFVL